MTRVFIRCEIGVCSAEFINTHMSNLTFKEFISGLDESNGSNDHCSFIKDPKLRKQCRKLMQKSPRVRMYGGGFGSRSGAGTGPGPGTGGGQGPGTGQGGGAFGGPGGAGGAFGGGGSGGA